MEAIIRKVEPHEHDAVKTLITTVATETFADLFAPQPVPVDFSGDDLSVAWVAVCGSRIVGVMLTDQEWVGDLWVHREHRNQGVGGRLLAQGEAEIADRGFRTCRLRVVKSNTVAVRFYLGRGWEVAREFPHEKYRHAMLELTKLNRK